MNTNNALVLVLTGLVWLFLCLVLASVIAVNATGDRDIFAGLRWILAGILVVVLWGLLSGLLLMAGGQGILPTWVGFAAMILVPASAASAFGGLYLSSQLGARWPMILPMSVPVLIAGYVVLLSLPSVRAFAATPAVSGLIWAVVLVLSIVLWPSVSRRVARNEDARAEAAKIREAAVVKQKEEDRTANLEKLKTMRPDQPLPDWYPLLEPDSGVRTEALQALKTVERRQGDAEQGLNYGIQAIMQLVPELDLQYTPELCEAAHVFLQKTAEGLRLTDTDPHPYQSNKYMEAALQSVSWFTVHGCNCNDGIAAIESCVRAYQDTPDRQRMLRLLATLKETK